MIKSKSILKQNLLYSEESNIYNSINFITLQEIARQREILSFSWMSLDPLVSQTFRH